jgi:hypothetical protein
MKRTLPIANRLREVLLNGYWVANTNFKEQILGVNWQQATQKVGNLNTIAALTFHISYYLEGLSDTFNSGKLNISDKYSFNLPEIQSEKDWQTLVNNFLTNSKNFIARIELLEDEILDEPFVDERYGTYLRNVEGVIEHSYYHLGQVSLIKKLIQIV